MSQTPPQIINPLDGQQDNERHSGSLQIMNPLDGQIDEDDTSASVPGGAGLRRCVVVVST